MKRFFYNQLTYLRDMADTPDWLVDLIDWLRYGIFWPND